MATDSSDVPPLLSQLRIICKAHPYVSKIVLVPRSQLGRALEDASARDTGGWAGLSCLLPRHYAEQLAEPVMHASGRSAFPVEGGSFLAAQMLEELGREGRFEDLPVRHQFASTVAEAITTLRLGAIERGTLQEHVDADGASDSLRAVAVCYGRYLDVLDRRGLYDDADVFAWATECVGSGRAPQVKNTVIATCNGLDLPERAYRFVRALQAEGRAFYRIGAADPGTPPPQTAAALFRAAHPPPDRSNASSGGSEADTAAPRVEGRAAERHFCRAVGAANEVKAVFRDLLDRGIPLDEVEIAYTESRPYLSLIADRADQAGMPITTGTGLPASLTRTGQFLRTFYAWITEDFDAVLLIRMLRSGHLRIDRVLDGLEDRTAPLAAHEAATLLAARSYEPGRAGLPKGLGRAIREKEKRIRELEGKDLDPARERKALARHRLLHRVVEKLLALAPRSGTVREMAAESKRLIERFGPIDKPSADTPEEERTLEEAARAVFLQRLDKLERLPFEYEAPGGRLAALFRRWIEKQHVRAEHPRPGAAHVLPLESAGYSGRARLYVVGLDSDTLSTVAVEDAVLRDADRRALSASLEVVLPGRRAAPDEAHWRMAQALRRHTGPVSFYSRIFDVESGEERHPSSLFLQFERQHGSRGIDGEPPAARVAGFLPHPQRNLVLDDGEAWLAAYANRRAPSARPSETARERLQETYPWILDGEAGRRARAADVYTEHDGLLAEGTYPELDFFSETYDGTLSAGRLETLAETPYLYFLRYVLDVHPLDEPALDDAPWLHPRRRGNLLHATFASFMQALDGAPPTVEHEALLQEQLRVELEREVGRMAPPGRREKEAARRQLLEDALLFLRAEAAHAEDHEALYHEVGFGFDPYRRREADLGDVTLAVAGEELPVRGRIDRVDRRSDGTLAVWDYKTGSIASFDARDPLQDGATLQWALYAYALEKTVGETVATSGYFFTSAAEMGMRLAFAPAPHRSAVDDLLVRLSRQVRSGSFPMNPKAADLGRWTWDGYDRLFLDLAGRGKQLRAKDYPEGRPLPPWLDG